MSRIRTFVALELTEEVRRRAMRLIERFQRTEPNFKWVARDNLHLTLNFLGDVDERNINEVCGVVADVAGTMAPFDVGYASVGAFPNAARPRIVWIGVDQGHDDVSRLQQNVADDLSVLGFPKESRKYRPHVTIGRARRGGRPVSELAELVESESDFRAGDVSVNEVTIFASRLQSTGPVYEALSHAKLGRDL